MRFALRRRSVLLGGLLVAAIAVNAVQFRGIDAAARQSETAVHLGATSDLAEIAYFECPWCRDRYSLHIALAAVAPGSRVVAAPSDPFTLPSPYEDEVDAIEEVTARLLTFGRAARVDWLEDDAWARDPAAPRLVAGVDPTPFIVASGEGGGKGAPWALAVDPSRMSTEDPPDRFLSRALATGSHQDSPHPPGEFVLVRWYAPRLGACHYQPPCYSYQDLLLETSLLPEQIRGSL